MWRRTPARRQQGSVGETVVVMSFGGAPLSPLKRMGRASARVPGRFLRAAERALQISHRVARLSLGQISGHPSENLEDVIRPLADDVVAAIKRVNLPGGVAAQA